MHNSHKNKFPNQKTKSSLQDKTILLALKLSYLICQILDRLFLEEKKDNLFSLKDVIYGCVSALLKTTSTYIYFLIFDEEESVNEEEQTKVVEEKNWHDNK